MISKIENGNCPGQRIDSLQSLRALAFLGIFLSHAQYSVHWPALGVSVFYVMSGFLMMYRYEGKEFDISLRNNLIFSLRKIKKIYPLHIITMIFSACLYFERMVYPNITFETLKGFLDRIILNVTLLQTWVPDSSINVSLNGVAWYLSVTMFLYFVFPYIHRFIKENKLYKLCVMCVVLLFMQIAFCIPFIRCLGSDSLVYIWFMYCFPVFRTGDFFVGCVLKKFFLK